MKNRIQKKANESKRNLNEMNVNLKRPTEKKKSN